MFLHHSSEVIKGQLPVPVLSRRVEHDVSEVIEVILAEEERALLHTGGEDRLQFLPVDVTGTWWGEITEGLKPGIYQYHLRGRYSAPFPIENRLNFPQFAG